MAHGQSGQEFQQSPNRTALLLAIDWQDARDRTTARHYSEVLAIRDISKQLGKVLVRLAGSDRSLHDSKLVDNTNLRKMASSKVRGE